MRELVIRPNEAGQRLDKFLHKYMKEAPSSLFYKMMRKKNIVLNGQKCTGQEMLAVGDSVKLFFAEETLIKFGAPEDMNVSEKTADPLILTARKAYTTLGDFSVIYEDDHIVAINKPAGILTQKSQPSDLSLNEWLIGYLLSKKSITEQELHTFHPSVCNRLDRNTSGLVLCARSLAGAQFLTECLKERTVHKYYRLFVKGCPVQSILTGWLVKDSKNNKVTILKQQGTAKNAVPIKTGISPIAAYTLPDGQKISHAQAELFTGKSHQIRAHFASVGHNLLGDEKYGDPGINKQIRRLRINSQMLHAYQIVFPARIEGAFSYLSGTTITAPEPAVYQELIRFCQNNKES